LMSACFTGARKSLPLRRPFSEQPAPNGYNEQSNWVCLVFMDNYGGCGSTAMWCFCILPSKLFKDLENLILSERNKNT
jgi:hypothetical protein